MKLIKTNLEDMPVRTIPQLYCFGGHNVCIQTDKIENIEFLYWDGGNEDDYIPILMFTLKDGTKISVDYDTEEDAKYALNHYKKEFIKVVCKSQKTE